MSPFLETDRLKLKHLTEEDIEFERDLKNHPEIRRYHPELYPKNKSQIREWIESVSGEEGNLVLTIWRENERIGSASLSKPLENSSSAGTGISVHPEFQGQGYATEAMGALIDYGFLEWNLHRVFSGVLEFNKASQRVWEKLGFTEEAVHRDYTYCEGGYQDLIEYGLLEDEWRKSKREQE